ncbi:hypothetical protein AK972_3132 [Pseudomonas yamanorum]|uniref:hypothetical protein n=1 Tax=Pseudomonas yamanorum TaxID=515393 RepID=UPI0007A662E1|nr:hypothetical protein [Pseudomonas yamanorum]AMW83932.1 hypothetical protein AK972_3132 [Pseudomonas yamanorum]
MKKLPIDYKDIALRKHRFALIKVLRSTQPSKSKHKLKTVIHHAPIVFCAFTEPRNELIKFIEKIRFSVISGCRSILIDFSRTQKFIASGTILFFSEIDRLLDLFPKLNVRSTIPLNKKASLVLQQIGFYTRIGKKVPISNCELADVINWRVAKGQDVSGANYDVILGKYDGVITPALQEDLYAGLTEAMTNAHHHAYIARRSDGIASAKSYKPWWMFSQEKDGMLSVVFCDLGVGIPGSLPYSDDDGWRKWYLVLSRFGLQNLGDARLIRGAIRHSKTRTRKHNRGKGLTQIVETVLASKDSVAIVQSNRGWYQIKKGKETYGDFTMSTNGTIIYWQMPLTARPGS